MGVAGLWEILEGTSQSIPISRLSLEAFNTSPTSSSTSPRPYALRIGIDASLWTFHANRQSSQAGLNPALRTLFFKTLKLLQHPILPLFVFDGPFKPGMKRNQKVAGMFGTTDQASKRFKGLLDDMGIEYWTAPGEAEAELAQLSKLGKIDAVLTDDVDALVFGATKILRNTSRTLSSNNRLVYDNIEDFQVYTLENITRPAARIRVARRTQSQSDGMIFIALCSGGDYHTISTNTTAQHYIGPKIAHGLAQTPLSTELINAYKTSSPEQFQNYLVDFRESLKRELSTNSLGFLPNKRKQLAQTLPSTFPQVEIIDYYVNPRISKGQDVWPGFGQREEGTPGAGRRGGRGDPRSFAIVCEKYFEWGTKEEVGKRMKTLVWRGEVINQLREKLMVATSTAAVTATGGKTKNSRMTSYFHSVSSSQSSARSSQDKGKGRALGPTSSTGSLVEPMEEFPRARLVTIHSTRQHASTGMILEYRIEYDHKTWTRTVQAVMQGTRIDPELLPEQDRIAMGLTTGRDPDRAESVTSETADDESANDRLWIPAELVKAGWPELVEAYETKLREKAEKAALRTPRR
ncbi:PIN domain-like protein, partial [Filobasidium floriforme]|uniref:PIN domain-like protein n=1 Tax=Filobasidium floriforme TaxID=5210 RepID=UPI001E8E03BD